MNKLEKIMKLIRDDDTIKLTHFGAELIDDWLDNESLLEGETVAGHYLVVNDSGDVIFTSSKNQDEMLAAMKTIKYI